MKRLKPKDRRAEILAATLQLARKHGYTHVSRDAIAAASQCSPALVSAYFGTMPAMRRAIMREAIRTHDLVVIAQGMAARDTRVMRAPEELRRAAFEALMA